MGLYCIVIKAYRGGLYRISTKQGIPLGMQDRGQWDSPRVLCSTLIEGILNGMETVFGDILVYYLWEPNYRRIWFPKMVAQGVGWGVAKYTNHHSDYH